MLAEQMDCLAFKQIDEDVEKFSFANDYFEDTDYQSEVVMVQRSEKNQLRTILRALILWSRRLKINDEDCCITYGDGFIRIIQRLITITESEEDCFWILTGLIRSFPRPFAIRSSVLDSDIDSCMRYELTTFKAMLEKYLPAVHNKLQEYGFPVEFMVYKCMTSFYANYFTSEMVLRLWDIIIFNFSSGQTNEERKRGIWWILAPAYLILQEKEQLIINATSVTQITNEFQSGPALIFNPDEFINKLKAIIDKIFIEGTTVQRISISRLAMTIFGRKTEAEPLEKENQNAAEFEEKRKKYMNQLKEIFEITRIENSMVHELVGVSRELLDGSDKTHFQMLNQEFLGNVKKVSSVANEMDLQSDNDESGIRLEEQIIDPSDDQLPIKSVHVFLHALSHEPTFLKDGYRLKVIYTKIDEDSKEMDGQQFSIVDGDIKLQNGEVLFKNEIVINRHSYFNYWNTYNLVKIQMVDPQDDQVILADT